MTDTKILRSLSIAEWTALVQNGASLTVSACLDGTSMQPLIRKERDLVTVSAVNRALKRGDIVLFKRFDGAYVMHRIRRIRPDAVTTLGDNCWKEDAPIERADVLGIAVSVQRGKHRIDLDNALSRAAGRGWMVCHGSRICYRRMRSAMIRCIKRVLRWKKAEW